MALNAITSQVKLVRKIEVRRPTLWGYLLIFLLLGALGTGLIFGLYPFLAQNDPLPQAELVIIEGWIGDAELSRALADVKPGQIIVTTGGPIKFGASLIEEKTYAEATAARLRKLGVSSVIVASAPDTSINRTYAAALAVREKLEEEGLLGRSANLYSLGAHSRRSYLLYRLALDSNVSLGIIALESSEYDLDRWWTSSLAFKHVVIELISWIYIQCTRWRF